MVARSVFTDPSTDGPGFQFGLGDAQPKAFFSSAPAVPEGTAQDWTIVEYHASQVLDPTQTMMSDPSTFDRVLGIAVSSWKTLNGNIALAAYGIPELDDTALYTRMAAKMVRTVTGPLDKITH